MNITAYCGLYCGACEIYIAIKNNKLDELAKQSDISEKLLYCEGCKSNKLSVYCRNCTMKKCCISKKISSCSECDEFPCSVLSAFENDQCLHHKGVIDSLKQLKNSGEEEWLKIQKNRFSCKKCGEHYSWYTKKCIKCNEPV